MLMTISAHIATIGPEICSSQENPFTGRSKLAYCQSQCFSDEKVLCYGMMPLIFSVFAQVFPVLQVQCQPDHALRKALRIV